MMPLELDSAKRQPRPRTTFHDTDADEKYEARIAFSVQMAFSFFCCLIVLAIIMAATIARQGYFVVVLVALGILLTLAVGFCWFLWHILTEEEHAPHVNQKHMPKWYRTVTKMIREELSDFRDDWKAMCNNLYLLEDGSAGGGGGEDNDDHFEDEDVSVKPKKRRGKSSLFKLVASPAAVLANFRNKRKEKKRRKKAQAAAERVTPFPSTV